MATSLTAALSVVPVLTAGPASATGGAVGAVAFEGTAALPRFPCAVAPYGPGPCTGTLSGGSSGHVTGTVAGGQYQVSWVSLDDVRSTFTYWEDICVEPSTVFGHAEGDAYGWAEPGSIRGDWKGSDAVPRDITQVWMSFHFVWVRVGTAAVLTFPVFNLSIDIAGLGWQRVASVAPPATATFVPTSVDDPHEPTCAQPVSMRGEIAGELTIDS